MASTYHQLLSRICGNEETLKNAKDLLNIARAKTGPGSGRDLGGNATALPAICAFLASESLGNNDVKKEMAQQSSCLRPREFDLTLNTVQDALSSYLSRKRTENVSYQSLCQAHGLNEDALYWMEQVDKELRKSGELNDLEVDEETVLLMVFYWTCIALNIRSVKQSTIIAKYEVPLDVFQDLEELLDSTCYNLKEKMDKFVSESRGSRSAGPTPGKAQGRTLRRRSGASPIKDAMDNSHKHLSSPTKTPSKSAPLARMLDGTPSKRKAVLPPLPFMTPTKKQKTTSPIKLNRIPVTSTLSTPSKSSAEVLIPTLSPTKKYGSTRSLLASPTKLTPSKHLDEAELVRSPTEAQSVELEESIDAEPPATPMKNRIGKRLGAEQSTPSTPSPRKAVQLQASLADPSTPTKVREWKNTRPRLSQLLGSDFEMMNTQLRETEGAFSESSEDEEGQPPPCRHGIPIFADRLFYRYRDPRVIREWECEKTFILEQGNLLGDLTV
ncbi:hypothetical protein ACEPAI_4836 [Sanghuangporus weigelae]